MHLAATIQTLWKPRGIAKSIVRWLSWTMLPMSFCAYGDSAVCPAANGGFPSQTSQTAILLISSLSNGASCGANQSTKYDDLTSLSFDFTVFLPCGDGVCEGDGANGDPVKIVAEDSAESDLNISNLECEGATISGLNTTVGEVLLNNGESCALYVRWDNAGNPITFSGATLSRNADEYSLTAGGVVKGEDAGGTPDPIPSTVSANVNMPLWLLWGAFIMLGHLGYRRLQGGK